MVLFAQSSPLFGRVSCPGAEVVGLPAGQPGDRLSDGGFEGIAKADIGIPRTGGGAPIGGAVVEGDGGGIISIVGKYDFQVR